MSLNKIVLSISNKIKPIISPVKQAFLTWILLIILISAALIYCIYRFINKKHLLEGLTPCNINNNNKQWREDINIWCTKTNNKINNLQTFFVSVDIINQMIQKQINKIDSQLKSMQQTTGVSHEDMKKAVKPGMKLFNSCGQNNCPKSDSN